MKEELEDMASEHVTRHGMAWSFMSRLYSRGGHDDTGGGGGRVWLRLSERVSCLRTVSCVSLTLHLALSPPTPSCPSARVAIFASLCLSRNIVKIKKKLVKVVKRSHSQ